MSEKTTTEFIRENINSIVSRWPPIAGRMVRKNLLTLCEQNEAEQAVINAAEEFRAARAALWAAVSTGPTPDDFDINEYSRVMLPLNEACEVTAEKVVTTAEYLRKLRETV